MRIILTLLCMLISMPSVAAELNLQGFKTLPILHEGRIKPMDSFAKIHKQQISGHDKDAAEWLATTLFNPENASAAPLFQIRNTTLKNQLSLNTDQSVFSLQDLQPGLYKTQNQLPVLLEKDQATLSADEKALLDLHDKAFLYSDLLRSFSAILPITTPEGDKTFFDLKAENKNVDIFINTGAQSRAFKVLPSSWDRALWLSPWESILGGKGSPTTSALLQDWAALAKAYRQKDQSVWDASLDKIKTNTFEQSEISPARLSAESTYKTFKPYLWVIGLYAIAALLASRHKFALAATLLAIAIHAGSIALRIYILGRPPVGTLYESVLFVSLICAAIGLLLSWRKTETTPIIVGNVAALGLLVLSPMLAKGGDSLEVLVAVLNTNFWLGTHVICITIGYGVCIITAMLAHAALIAKALNKAPALWLTLQKQIHHMSLIALFFTTFGTILGGIWADQSWGRFWGWDPKENGALLIVLWLIWVQHGRLSGHIKPLGVLALMAALNIVVALAWFGVNLLSVGLHSYGFIDGIAQGLAAFVALEIILISALSLKIRSQPA